MAFYDVTKQEIFDQAKKRIAKIFSIPVESLNLKDRFDGELQASFVSDFKDNEFDKINYDLQDVADKSMRKKLQSGDVVVNTVEDYCEYMCACFEVNPKGVYKVLGF